MAKIIDVHTHMTPPYIPAGHNTDGTPRDKKWPSLAICTHEADEVALAELKIEGNIFRKLDQRCWDAHARLADMDAEGVDIQVLSPMPELLSFWIEQSDAQDLAQMVNSHLSDMIAVNPDRFIGLGMITAQAPAIAVTQLEALAKAGFRGIEIGTHINETPLGDKSLFPIYETAERLGLALFIHPLHPAGCERIGVEGIFGHAAAFPMEIAKAALAIVTGGVIEKFPRLRIMLSHGGGSFVNLLPRLSKAWAVSDKIRQHMAQEPKEYGRSFWYDTNVYDEQLLAQLADRVGADRISIGTDYPFIMRQDFPAEYSERACPNHSSEFSAAAQKWLYGDTHS